MTEFYNVNLSDKLKNSVTNVKNFKLDLDSNIEDIKKKADRFARKEINFNFIDTFTRNLYSNKTHLFKLEMFQYIMFIVLIYYYNPLNINVNFPVFTKLLVLAVSFIYVVLFIFIRDKVTKAEDIDLINPTETNILKRFISTIVFFILFVLAIKGLIWILINTSVSKFVHTIMAILIVTGLLGIVYLFMRTSINKAKNTKGQSFLALLLKIVMYLPCLLVDTIEAIKFEFNLTTKPVWILMGVEASFVGLFFLLPVLLDKIVNSDGLRLLAEPIRLNIEKTIGNYDQLYKMDPDIDTTEANKYDDDHKFDMESYNCANKNDIDPDMPHNKYLAWIYQKKQKIINAYNKTINSNMFKIDTQTNKDTDTNIFRYKYALSAWFNINPQPPNTNSSYGVYTNILNYGKKISIEYNGGLNTLRVMAEVANANPADPADPEENNKIVEVYKTKEVIYQKWNNIVINYDDGFIDVFLNGALVGTIQGVAPYMTEDTIKSGADKGLYGGICNVVYYTHPLKQPDIVRNFKALRTKDLPYIGK
jgi:hypothetical protein